MEMRDVNAVWHKDKLYTGGGWVSGFRRDAARLYIYTTTTDTWDTPIDTPVSSFALTTYHSQLVLVGGREYVDEKLWGEHTNKLWTLSEDGQWQETLPSMETKRHHACAVSYKDHLLVAGGISPLYSINNLNVVEVFNGNHWSFAQPLPTSYHDLKSAILDQHWYLMGGLPEDTAVHYASLDLLIASCQPSKTSQPSAVWKRLTDAPYQKSSTAVFGNKLIAIGGEGIDTQMSTVHAYSFHTNSWIHVGDVPLLVYNTCSVVLPTGELMVVGGYNGIHYTRNVLKATIKGNIKAHNNNLYYYNVVGIANSDIL